MSESEFILIDPYSPSDLDEFNCEECFCSVDEEHEPECPYALKLEPLLKVIAPR